MNRNLDSVQALRGIAAVSVALHHASDQIETFPDFQNGTKSFWIERAINTDTGAIGVDIFFLISGFIMAYTTHQKPTTAGQFLKRRFIRIYPLYWFFSLVVIGIHCTPWLGRLAVNTATTIKAFLLYPSSIHYLGVDMVRPAFLGQGWTLIYEILFYLLFALFIKLSQPSRLLIITGIFALAGQLALRFFPGTAEGLLLSDPIIFEFSGGLLLGWLFSTGKLQLSRGALFSCLAIAILLTLPSFFIREFQTVPRLIRLGLPALFLVGPLVLSPATANWKFPAFLKLLGDASYSIYLTHTIVLLLFITGYIRLPILQALSLDVYFLILIAAIVMAGLVSYFFVEKPLLNLCRKIA